MLLLYETSLHAKATELNSSKRLIITLIIITAVVRLLADHVHNDGKDKLLSLYLEPEDSSPAVRADAMMGWFNDLEWKHEWIIRVIL